MQGYFAYIHVKNDYEDGECGRPAFYLERMPAPGSRITSRDVLLADGKRPEEGEPIRCQSCGEALCWYPGSLPVGDVRAMN